MGVVTIQTTPHTMNTKLVLLFAFVCVASGRVFLIDDGDYEDLVRVRRDAPPSYGPPAPAYSAPHHGGRVGPVYTFVKTDPRPTSSGASGTGLELSTEDKKP